MSQRFNFSCDKFLGINYNKSNTRTLLSGESPEMVNFTVTEALQLKKRLGYSVLDRHFGEGRGLWCGELWGRDVCVFVVDKDVFEYCDGEVKCVGELESTSGQVDFLRFSDRLYVLDGTKIKVLESDKFSTLEPYRPLVAVSTTPDGAGVPFEEKNLLTGAMRQTFTMNSTSTTLTLSVKNLDSVDYVKAGDTAISQYTANLEAGTVTLPDSYKNYSVIDGIEVGFTKSDSREGEVHRMHHALLFGGENDTRVFLWGDEASPDLIRYSGVHSGISGMEYFPENNFNRTGTRTCVTSVVRHYDRLMIFCRGETFYSYMETVSGEGLEYEIFPQRPLSDTVGSQSASVAVIDNFPVTLDRGTLWRWRSSSVRDERYAEDIGARIKSGLGEWSLKDARLFDSEVSDELLISSGDEIYVYNYRLDVFYLWCGISAVSFGNMPDGRRMFLRRDGSLCALFESDSDDGVTVSAFWSTPYLELAEGIKNLHRASLEIVPGFATLADLSWVSEHGETGRGTFFGRHKRFSFEKLNFAHLGFRTGLAEKSISMRMRHKRFEKLKLRLENSYPNSDLHVVSFTLSGIVTDKK